uniref:Uncharacterized protein n=1 Tax=Cucumis sativus TaxID=3659 RepID=A0A0A0LNC9_CUCSA
MNTPTTKPNKIPMSEMSHRHQLRHKRLLKLLPFFSQTFHSHHSSITRQICSVNLPKSTATENFLCTKSFGPYIELCKTEDSGVVPSDFLRKLYPVSVVKIKGWRFSGATAVATRMNPFQGLEFEEGISEKGMNLRPTIWSVMFVGILVRFL